MKKSIDIKRILYIVFGIMFAASMLLFASAIGKEKSKAVAETTTNATEMTVEVTEAYTFTDSAPATHHASTSPAVASWETALGMKKFCNTFNTAESKFYVGFNGIDTDKYSYISFRMLIWAAQKEDEEVSYIPAEFFTTENVSSCKTDVPYSWKYGDASSFSDVEAFRVFLPTDCLKNKNGMINGFIVKNPLTRDLSGWVMVSDITLTNEMPVVLDTAVDKTNLKATNTYGIVQDDFRVAEWRNYGLRNRLQGDGSDKAFVAKIGFDRTIYAGAVDRFTFNALGWGKASTPCVIVKNLNGTIASRLTLYYAYDCKGNLSVTIPAKGLADENGGINGFILESPNGVDHFVFSDITAVKEPASYNITSENVTFKLGGNYGESVYYDLQGSWTGVGAGWIVNKTPTTGDVNVYLNINEEKALGKSIFGLVRLEDTKSEWATASGFYNYFVNGSEGGFSVGTWPDHKVFLNEYDSGTLSARTLVGTNKSPVTHGFYTGKAKSYAEAKDWTYFGFGWGNRAYEIKTKIQIYDAANNDLGILASEPSRESYSCRLMGKVGERVYFTVKDGAVPVVTADGEAIELTAEADGRYSFVMPAKKISVTAKSNKIALEVQKNGTVVKTEEIAKTAEGFAAAIPEVNEKDVKLVGYEIGGKLYKTISEAFAAADMSGEKVVVNLIAPRVETEDGAAIRKNGTAGMRFSSVVTLSAHIKKYGMILTVRDNVDNGSGGDGVGIENFTKDKLSAVKYKYLEIANTNEGFKSYSKGGNEMFSIVLTAIKDNHRELEYIARTYVVVEYDNGNSETYYSDVDFENNARSAHEVAVSVLESEKDKLSAEQKEFIESNYLSLNVLSLTAYYGPVSGAYMVNGKVVSNNGGGVYDIATVSDVKAFFDAGFDFIMGDDADYMTYRSMGHSVGDGYVDPDGNADLAYYPNSDAARLLNLVKDYCDEYGVPYKKARVLVKLGYLEGAMGGENGHTDGMIQINLTRVYGYLKEYPCFGGFILRDEPRGYMSETYNKWYKWLVDDLGVYRDGYMLYGALLGMNAAPVNVAGSSDDDTANYSGKAGLTAEQYETYLNKYIAGLSGVGQEGLSFDYYPFTETINRSLFGSHSTSYEMKKQYYQNLEIFAKLSETKGYKRTMCLQSVAFYNKTSYNKINGSGTKSSYTYYGAVSEQMMTYQLYAALAYGYNGVAYFTYTQPSNQTDAEWFSNAAYMWEKQADGSFKAVKTAAYDYIKNANAEAMAMSRKIVGYKWLGTTYSVGTSETCGIFGGTTSYNGGVLTSVASSYDSYAGCMKNGNGEYGFMVVNADDPRNGRSNSVTLSFADGYTSVSYVENGETKTAALTNGAITLNIGAGKGIFVVPHKR